MRVVVPSSRFPVKLSGPGYKIMLTLLFDSGKIGADQKKNLLDLTLIKCGVADDLLYHERRVNRSMLFS